MAPILKKIITIIKIFISIATIKVSEVNCPIKMTFLYYKKTINKKNPKLWRTSIKRNRISSFLFWKINNKDYLRIKWSKIKLRRINKNKKTSMNTWYKNTTNKALFGHPYKPATMHHLKEQSSNKNYHHQKKRSLPHHNLYQQVTNPH